MASITFAIDEELKVKLSKIAWVVWSELVREKLMERQKQVEFLFKKLKSGNEQELISWSVDLGRRAKKGRFKELLSKISPKIREELLISISPEKREELLK